MHDELQYDYDTPIPCTDPSCPGDAIFTMIIPSDDLDGLEEDDVEQVMVYTCILCKKPQIVKLYKEVSFNE